MTRPKKPDDRGRAHAQIDAVIAEKARAGDPHAWEAMLNLNKMRTASRKRDVAKARRSERQRGDKS